MDGVFLAPDRHPGWPMIVGSLGLARPGNLVWVTRLVKKVLTLVFSAKNFLGFLWCREAGTRPGVCPARVPACVPA